MSGNRRALEAWCSPEHPASRARRRPDLITSGLPGSEASLGSLTPRSGAAWGGSAGGALVLPLDLQAETRRLAAACAPPCDPVKVIEAERALTFLDLDDKARSPGGLESKKRKRAYKES